MHSLNLIILSHKTKKITYLHTNVNFLNNVFFQMF